MAAACDTEGLQDATSEDNTLTETEIVAQAITELQQICAPTSVQGDISSTVAVSETESSIEASSLLTSYFRNEDPGLNNGETEVTDSDIINEATQVIYYIEDGVVARSEKVLVDTSVQANDYEIERRSGRLPARKRVIPFKFRDYKNTSNDEDSDSDYEPDVKSKIRKVHKETTASDIGNEKELGITPQRKPGRPRKYPVQANSTVITPSVVTSEGQKQNEAEGQTTETKAEDLSQNDAEGGQTQNEAKEINVTVIKIKEETDEEGVKRGNEETDEHDENDDDVTFISMRKGRGRPRGPDWRKNYKCPECGKVFGQKGNLKTHLRTHTDERPFACTEEDCEKLFRSHESLRRHILSHRGIKPFECDICHNKFSSNVGLQEHRSRHTDSKPHKCPHCPKHFRQVSCLRRHVLTHSSEKPYECNLCHTRFSQMAYLKSHMKVHTGEKPFACDICPKRFAHQSDVKRHKITHTGEKRYSCEICQAKFSDPSSKRRHEKEHSKTKAYICQLCDETFSRSGQLKAHLTSKHMLAIDLITGKSSLLFDIHNESAGINDSVASNQRIAQLIKSLSTKTNQTSLDTTGMDLPSLNNQIENQSQSASVTMTSAHVTEVSQLQQAGETAQVETSGDNPIELQGIEIQEEEVGGQTFIAITDLAESLLPAKGSAGEGGVCHYQIIQEVGENGDTHQVLVPLTQANEAEINDVIQETVENIQDRIVEVNLGHSEASIVTTDNKDTENFIQAGLCAPETEVVSEMEKSETLEAVAIVEQDSTAQEVIQEESDSKKTIVFDYVTNPDFSSQDYYNWLSNFTELCKVVPMPLDVSLFQKISQVHKTLSDVMATPSGVVADKENFRVLMNITKELSTIINEHLVYVLENLNPEPKSKDNS